MANQEIPSIPTVTRRTPDIVMEYDVAIAINDLLTLSHLLDEVAGQHPSEKYRESKLLLLTQVMREKAKDLDQRYEDSLRNYANFLTGGAA